MLTEALRHKQQQLREIVEGSDNVVFFGGAGVSTESGIPDFRSADGLYNQEDPSYRIPPEVIISHTFFVQNPVEFYRFYRDKMIFLDAQPNPAHRKLAELEQRGIVKAVVTQNIDGLHQAAGSRNVFELHGSVLRNYCAKCGAKYPVEAILEAGDVPLCPECGGIIRPDVVLYEEGLDSQVIDGAVRAIASADVLIIAGTSLVVYPAAGFIDYFRGDHLVIINLSPTPRDRHADLLIEGPVGEIMDW